MIAFYASIAIGPNLVKSRLGGSVLAYLIIYCVEQIVLSVALFVAVLQVGGQMANLEVLEAQRNSATPLTTLAPLLDQAVVVFVGSSCILSLVVGAVLYLLTRYFMTRKLNLA